MTVLCVIPARSGSKRIPSKNIRLLGGKPLLAWSIAAAIQSKVIDRLIVSTDSVEIASIAKEYGADVPGLRPAELAQDTSLTIDVIRHVINSYSNNEDIIIVLQPTTPLRNADDIRGALQLFKQYNTPHSVISVCEHSTPLEWVHELADTGQLLLQHRDYHIRSQILPKRYVFNGGVYVNYTQHLKSGTFFDVPVYGYIMPIERSVDIDIIDDFVFAEFILSKQHTHIYSYG